MPRSHAPEPVRPHESEDEILGRVLDALEGQGSVELADLVARLSLYSNPKAVRVVAMAIQDGVIEHDAVTQTVRLSGFGRAVSRDIHRTSPLEPDFAEALQNGTAA